MPQILLKCEDIKKRRYSLSCSNKYFLLPLKQNTLQVIPRHYTASIYTLKQHTYPALMCSTTWDNNN